MKKCECEHWQECPTCMPHRFDADGKLKPPELTPLQACRAELAALRAAQAEPVAQPARQPLDRWHIADILARERMQWTKSQPLFEFEFGEAIVRAVEREHGIGGEE